MHYFITGGLIHEACEDYYRGLNDSPTAAIQQKLITDLEKRGLSRPKAISAIIAAKNEQELIDKFRSGEYRKPDGELYSAYRMTKIWKTETTRLGLDLAQRELGKGSLPGVELPDGGLVELAGRILDLTRRYEDKLLIKREKLEVIMPEVPFDFMYLGTRFLGFMDLVAKVKPEFRNEFNGKSWILIDYKSGKAHPIEDHNLSAHQSMQLSLYEHVVTQELKLCDDSELYTALHYLDATHAAVTTRNRGDFKMLAGMAHYYQEQPKHPGLVKRLFYEDGCSRCELKAACIKHFGQPTSACGQTSADDSQDWSF